MSAAPSARLHIATQNEGPLHAALKDWYALPDDREEVPLDGRQIDLVRGDLLVEIQTSSFSSLRRKLEGLLDEHKVRVVHPVPVEKWIVRVAGDEQRVLGRRKSPTRGRVVDAFEQLVSVARLLPHENLSVEILLTQEEEVRRHEPGRVWRRKGWVIVERRLLEVLESHVFDAPADLRRVLPDALPTAFTTADLAEHAEVSRDLAQKIAYALREAGAVEPDGKRGNARVYRTPTRRAARRRRLSRA